MSYAWHSKSQRISGFEEENFEVVIRMWWPSWSCDLDYSPIRLHTTINSNGLVFSSKGLHFCNLNIQHLLPKMDEV